MVTVGCLVTLHPFWLAQLSPPLEGACKHYDTFVIIQSFHSLLCEREGNKSVFLACLDVVILSGSSALAALVCSCSCSHAQRHIVSIIYT